MIVAVAAGLSAPALSVLIATPDSYETIRTTIAYLRAQALRDRLEIVILAPSHETLGLDESELAGFHGAHVVEFGELTSVAAARAAGVSRAGADVVAFAEDHAYPLDGWGEALLEGHATGHTAVGPVLVNANPQTAVSWVDLFLSYGPFVEGAPEGVVPCLPADNSSYKRAVLLGYGDALERMLEDERLLQRDLLARGHTLYLEPRARLLHVNFSRRSAWIALRYHGGREYGARRARTEGWSRLARLTHVLAAPVSVVDQTRRLLHDIRRSSHGHELLPRIVPDAVLAVLAGVAGETVGYGAGEGRSAEVVTGFRFHRAANVREEERGLVTAAPDKPLRQPDGTNAPRA